jgi:hypothetical protein
MFRSRVAMAVIGVLVLGGIGAALGAASAHRPDSSGPSTGITAGAPTASDASSSASVEQSPTATATTSPPAPAPTRTPRPTPTPPPIGVVADLHGEIRSVGTATAGTFVLRVYGGATYTVQTSPPPGTTYTGTATSFATLQVGMEATVTGMFPAANTAFQATQVNTQPVNN